jgi:hypothetical protein
MLLVIKFISKIACVCGVLPHAETTFWQGRQINLWDVGTFARLFAEDYLIQKDQ